MKSGAGDPVRWGVFGLGRWGMYHIERLGLRDDCHVLAAYDDDPATRARAAGLACRSIPWEQMLGDPDIEVLLIAGDLSQRASRAIRALEAGKHVVLERPMCVSLAEADAILSAGKAAQKMVTVCQLARWDEDFRTAQAACETGALGNLLSADLMIRQYHPRARPGRETGMEDANPDGSARAAGVLWEFGANCFDQLLQLVPKTPLYVSSALMSDEDPRCQQSFAASIKFAGGITASIGIDQHSFVPLHTGWMLQGTSGGYASSTEYTATPEGEVVDVPLTPLPNAWDRYYAGVVGHLRRGEPNPATAEEGRATLRLILAVEESAREGRVVRLGPS